MRAGRPVGVAAAGIALALVAAGLGAASSPPSVQVRFTSEEANSPHPPDSALAVGPTDMIEATNAGVTLFGKDGRREQDMEPIAGFFRAATWPSTSKKVTSATVAARYLKAKCCVDPHAVWDNTLQRFWFTAQQGPKDGTAYVFVALSKSRNAKDGWTAF